PRSGLLPGVLRGIVLRNCQATRGVPAQVQQGVPGQLRGQTPRKESGTKPNWAQVWEDCPPTRSDRLPRGARPAVQLVA
ncbi:hypothetical protein, partial [Mobiluncus curtisii]|uniref:hypothetical protein n=1 Tax=Mobiluncus curtisii TaxID=2051 RepID=UPI0021E25ACE